MLIQLRGARAQVMGACAPLPGKTTPTPSALGCVLSDPVIATESVPPFANSAMDGYAVRSEDCSAAPVTLRVIEAIFAGGVAERSLGPGEAMRVMTGAPVPEGADAVCMMERTQPGDSDGETGVVVTASVHAGENIRLAGEDVACGDVVFPAGTLIGPAHLGVLLSAGVSEVSAVAAPAVGVLATGDELTTTPGALAPGAIRDSNRPALIARLVADGFEVVDLGTARDELTTIAEAIETGAAQCDAVVTVGGVSLGDHDFIAAALDKLAAEPRASMQIAIKPGKPFAFGMLPPARTPVFGLPGNPVSAFVSYELLVRPALCKMARRRQLDRPALPATAPEGIARRRDGKIHFPRVQVVSTVGGELEARPLASQGSHQLRSFAEANALAILADGEGIPAGGKVTVLLLEGEGLSTDEPGWLR